MKRFLASIVVLTATSGAFACPMCKDSVPNKEGEVNELHDSYTANGRNISGGMNTSVYVMLGTFLSMIGLISTVVVKGVRSSDANRPFPPKDRSKDRE